ncbi:MAG: HEAT repeat domain-containing protein [Planctomycetes bacterium]|nr:HEAT repeat domain-containing protein [Planctomycetota bacterium]
MKIYFCDGCNESVPLADIQAGRVTTIQGKMFCSTCIPPGAVMSPAAPQQAAAPAASAGTPKLLLALVVLLVGYTVWRDRALFVETAAAPTEDLEAAPARDLPDELDALSSELAQLRADGGARAKMITSLRADLEALRETDAELRRASESQREVLDRVARTQSETGSFLERMELSSSRLTGIEERLDALSDAVMAHEAAIALGLKAPAQGPLGPTAAAKPEVDPARVALIEEVRRQLLSAEPGVRFEGVDRIEEGGYRELAPDLVTLLQDEDMFVRMHAMKVLGDFGYEEAVPALFDLLEDDNAAIRKTAGENLVRLTGFDPGFDPKASAGERSRAVKKWRDWYAAR